MNKGCQKLYDEVRREVLESLKPTQSRQDYDQLALELTHQTALALVRTNHRLPDSLAFGIAYYMVLYATARAEKCFALEYARARKAYV